MVIGNSSQGSMIKNVFHEIIVSCDFNGNFATTRKKMVSN
jgi:hypothetical protein